MSKDRVISSVVAISLVILALLNDWFFLFAVLALIIGGMYEFFYLIKKKGIPIYSYTGIFIGILIPISIFFNFELTEKWELLSMVLVLITIFILQFYRKDNQNAIIGISTTLFGIIYVSWFLSYLIKIRNLVPGSGGIALVAYLIIITKIGDMGALFVGSKMGKTPLIPRISPNKTVEGSLGGVVFSMAFAYFFKGFLPDTLNLAVWQILLMGGFFGVLGQMGDLSESLIKRDCQVKDSGKLLPGLGGVLDVIDSILFSAPAFYFFMLLVLVK